MTTPVCPVCTKPISKSPQRCPRCHVHFHPNCWRQVTFCTTCGVPNPERCEPGKKPVVKASESLTLRYDALVRDLHQYVSAPGCLIIALGLFLYVFRAASPAYAGLVGVGLLLLGAAALIRSTGSAETVISPSTRSVQRRMGLLGFTASWRLIAFDQILSFRIEGERRFKGDQKGVPSYFYVAHWIAIVDRADNHLRVSDEMRTDRDPDFQNGPEYGYGGLLASAQQAGGIVGVEAYVAPNVNPYRVSTLVLKASLLVALAVLVLLLL